MRKIISYPKDMTAIMLSLISLQQEFIMTTCIRADMLPGAITVIMITNIIAWIRMIRAAGPYIPMKMTNGKNSHIRISLMH